MHMRHAQTPTTLKGRGTTAQPATRFASARAEAMGDGWETPQWYDEDGEAISPAQTIVTDKRARSIVSHNPSPDVGFTQSINPIRGCEQAASLVSLFHRTRIWICRRPGFRNQAVSSRPAPPSRLMHREPGGVSVRAAPEDSTMNRKPSRLPLTLVALALVPAFVAAFAVQAATQPTSAPLPATSPADSSALDQAIAGAWRNPNNVARDKYRHPKETLSFIGVKPNQTVIEITPGSGWYTEILAPLVRDHGRYIGIVDDPASVKAGDHDEADEMDTKLRVKLAGQPTLYALAQVREIDYPAKPVLGPPHSADVVLTFRNVHNWVMGGTQAAMFKAFFDVLKPGGVLGVTDHRANPGPATDGKQGYVTEQQVIDYATAAGFVLDGKSEINANPKDTRDYPKGVWTLPPTLQLGEQDKARYLAIGESDRMTLRFVKPGVGAKR
jgi:predicted methyltransferase